MELIVKHFDELTAEELWEIYRVRTAVFVVEQQCAYQEVDIHDRAAYHIWLRDEQGMQAYLRVLPPHTTFETAAIGRVLSLKRRCGLATRIVEAGISVAREKFGAQVITIEAQTYARGLYEKLGFVQTSEEFLEDGIPHIQMRREDMN